MHTPTAKFEHRVDGDGEDEPRPCKVVPAPQPWRFGGITTAQNEMFIRSPNLSAITLEAEPLASKRLNHVLSVTSFKEWSALYLQLRQCLCVDQIRRIDFSEVELDGAQWGWLCQKMLPAMPKLASLRLVRMNITDMRLAELLGWCQRHDGLRGMAPFPRGTKKIFPLFPPLNGAQSIMSDDLLLGDVDADNCGQAGVSPVPCNEESPRTVFRELCVLDLSENYLTHRSATVIGKFMLWTADTLDELRLMGNPLQDYGLQVIGIYIARLQLSSLRKEAHLFPQSLVKLYSKIDERKSTVNNGVCQQKQEKPPGPSLTSCTISKRNFDTDRQAQDDTLHIHLGISLLDVRSCQASVRGISELAAAASLAHRMNTLLLAGNGLPSSPRPGRQPFRARECNNNIVESPLSSSTSDGSHGGYSVPSAKVDSLSSVCKLSRFAELRHPCALSTIDASGVALSEVCSPAGCRDFFLNLFFCCPKLKVFDISGSFDERQLSEPTKRQIFEDSRKVFSIQRQQEGGTHHHSLRDMANESDFALDRVSYDKQACVGNIFCELFAHAALNAVKRKCFAPAAFCRLKELRLEGTGMTDAAAKSLAIAVLSTTSTGVLADLVSLQVANNFLTSCGCACLLLTFVTEWPMTTSSLKYIALQGNLGTSCHDESSLNEVRQAVLFAVGRRIRDQRHGAQVPPLLVQFGAVGAEASSLSSSNEVAFRERCLEWHHPPSSILNDHVMGASEVGGSSSLCDSPNESATSPRGAEQQVERVDHIVEELRYRSIHKETVVSTHRPTVMTCVEDHGCVGASQYRLNSHEEPNYGVLSQRNAETATANGARHNRRHPQKQQDTSELRNSARSSRLNMLPSALAVEFGHLFASVEGTAEQNSWELTERPLTLDGEPRKENVTGGAAPSGDVNNKGEIRPVPLLSVNSSVLSQRSRSAPPMSSTSRSRRNEDVQHVWEAGDSPRKRDASRAAKRRGPRLRSRRHTIITYYHQPGDVICRGWMLLHSDGPAGQYARSCLEKDLLACLQPPEGSAGAVLESVSVLMNSSSSLSPNSDDQSSCNSNVSGGAAARGMHLLVTSNESRPTLLERLHYTVSQAGGNAAFPRFAEAVKKNRADMIEMTRSTLDAIFIRCSRKLGDIAVELFVHERHGREDNILQDMHNLLFSEEGTMLEAGDTTSPCPGSSAAEEVVTDAKRSVTPEPSASHSVKRISFPHGEHTGGHHRKDEQVRCRRRRKNAEESLARSAHGLSERRSSTTTTSCSPKQPAASCTNNEVVGATSASSATVLRESFATARSCVTFDGDEGPPEECPQTATKQVKTYVFPLSHREGGILCCGWRLLHCMSRAGAKARCELEADVMSFLQDTLNGEFSNTSGTSDVKPLAGEPYSNMIVDSVHIQCKSPLFTIHIHVATNVPRRTVSDKLHEQQQKEGEAAYPRFARFFHSRDVYNTVLLVERYLQCCDSSEELRDHITERYRTVSAFVHFHHANEKGLLEEMFLPNMEALEAAAEGSTSSVREIQEKDCRNVRRSVTDLVRSDATTKSEKKAKDVKVSNRSETDKLSGSRKDASPNRPLQGKSESGIIAAAAAKTPGAVVSTAATVVRVAATPPSTFSLLTSPTKACSSLEYDQQNRVDDSLCTPQEETSEDEQETEDDMDVVSLRNAFAEKIRRLHYLSYNAVAHGALLLDKRQRHKRRICKGKWGRVCVTVAVEWDVFLVLYFVRHSTFRVASHKTLVLVHPVARGVKCFVEVGGTNANGRSTGAHDVVIRVERLYAPEDLGLATSYLEQQLHQIITSNMKKKIQVSSLNNATGLHRSVTASESIEESRRSSVSALGSMEHTTDSLFSPSVPTAARLLQPKVTIRVTLKSASKAQQAADAIHEAGKRAVSMIQETIIEQQRQASARPGAVST